MAILKHNCNCIDKLTETQRPLFQTKINRKTPQPDFKPEFKPELQTDRPTKIQGHSGCKLIIRTAEVPGLASCRRLTLKT